MKIILSETQIKSIIEANITNEPNLSTDIANIEKGANKLGTFFTALKQYAGISDDNTSTDNVTNASISSSGLIHPLGKKYPITSHFGSRSIGIGSKNHKGIDIKAPSGTKIYAPKDGIVLEAKDTTPNGCGGFIELNHGNIKTKFCHVSRWLVNKGATVKQGQLIGYTGGGKNDPYRGTSTGEHLHYEILNNSGIAMNPLTVQDNLA